MAPLTGQLLADFTSFYEAAKTAEVSLKSMESGASTAESRLNRMADSLSGRKLVGDATLMAEAVDRIGGASVLTEAELGRVSAKATEAVEKLKALGKDVPPELQKLADATKSVSTGWQSFVADFNIKDAIANPLATATQGFSALAESIGPTGVALVGFAGAAGAAAAATFKLTEASAAFGAELDDMSDKTGISVPVLSKYSYAADVAHTSLTTLTDVVFKLERGMGEGSDKFEEGLRKMGLSTAELRAAGPDEYLTLITKGLDSIKDPAERAAAGTAVLGKGYRDNAAALADFGKALALTNDIQPWTTEQAANAEKFEMQIASMMVHAKAWAYSVGETFIGPTTALIKAFDDGATSAYHFTTALAGIDDAVEAWHWLTAAVDQFTDAEQKLPEVAGPATHALEESKRAADARAASPLAAAVTTETESIKRAEAELKRQLEESEAAAKKYAAAYTEVAAAGHDWRTTLETMNGTVLEAIKYGLQHGASIEALATVYGVTIEQVKDLKSALDDAADGTKRMIAMEQEYAAAQEDAVARARGPLVAAENELRDLKMKNALDATSYQIQKVWEWAEAQTSAYQGSVEQTAQYADTIEEIAEQKVEAIVAATSSGVQKMASDGEQAVTKLTTAATQAQFPSGFSFDASKAIDPYSLNLAALRPGSMIGFSPGPMFKSAAGPSSWQPTPAEAELARGMTDQLMRGWGQAPTMTNNFSIVDNTENIARKVSDSIMTSLQGRGPLAQQ